MKQYPGNINHDRDQRGVASAQPPAQSAQKENSNRKGEEKKKARVAKAGENREKR